MSAARRNFGGHVVVLVSVALATLYLLGPPAWLLMSSVTPEEHLRAVPPHWLPPQATLANYRALFQIGAFDRAMLDAQPEFKLFVAALRNSVILACSVTALCILFGAPSAYSLARFFRRGTRRGVMLGLLATRMVPLISLLIPIYIFYLYIGALNTLSGLVVIYTALLLPFVIWILEGFFRKFPIELEEAGTIDGASPYEVFRLIVLPLSVNGLFAAGAFVFISTWSDFIVALLLTSSIQAFPVSVVIAVGNDVVKDPPWGMINAAGLIAGLIPAAIAFALRGVIMRGLFSGAVKG
jgi:multiple sugar transport system permease protein